MTLLQTRWWLWWREGRCAGKLWGQSQQQDARSARSDSRCSPSFIESIHIGAPDGSYQNLYLDQSADQQQWLFLARDHLIAAGVVDLW